MTTYTMRCRATGETSTVIVCAAHAQQMPDTDSVDITANPAEPDLDCEFCATRWNSLAKRALFLGATRAKGGG